jgi:hypothetical protein
LVVVGSMSLVWVVVGDLIENGRTCRSKSREGRISARIVQKSRE